MNHFARSNQSLNSKRTRHERKVGREILHALEKRMLFSTFTVTKLVDDGTAGTLRWAVQQANAAPGSNTIDLSTITGQINLTQHTQLELTKTTGTTTITGPGLSLMDVSGYDPAENGSTTRVFQIDSNVTARFSGFSISDGTGTQGGGIYNAGNLTIDQCSITSNRTYGSSTTGAGVAGGDATGGGIFSSGTLTITNSSITGNDAFAGSASGNGANGGNALGGGIYSSGTATLTNSVVSNGQAFGGSGGSGGNSGSIVAIGIYAAGTMVINDSTIVYNTNLGDGLVVASGASVKLNNTLVTDHISGTLQSSSSHNLIQDGSGGLTNGTNGNILNVNAGVSYEGNYIGLGPSSPAIDAGDNSLVPAGITTDVRGAGYTRIFNSTVDIGSIESSGFQFVFTTQPVGTHATSTLNTVAVAIKDSYGNYINDNSAITLSLSGSGSGTLSGTTTRYATSNADVSFTDLSISDAGTYSLVATDLQDFGPMSITSNSFVISAALPASSLIDVQFSDSYPAQTGPAIIGSGGDTWNRLANFSFSPTANSLVDSSGNSSAVTLSYTGLSGQHIFNSPFAYTPYASLMSAALGGGGTLTLNNLTGSSYNLYLYSGGNTGTLTTFNLQGRSYSASNNYPASSLCSMSITLNLLTLRLNRESSQ